MTDRRTELRMGSARAARLVPDRGGRVLPCIVLNLSLTGARIETLEPVDVHRRFNLLFEGSGDSHHCQVVWQKENQIGVTFD
ncbi:MAG: PilZ domain-containing protein [Pseudorhodoplanes sp.]|nr:PilZ domain-containing protein [Pseudorhodoplanes sp.]